jgi:hypothetical protein
MSAAVATILRGVMLFIEVPSEQRTAAGAC